MLFKVSDFVVHPDHGVGHVVTLEEKRFSGKEVGLYYELAIQKSTVWVSVGSPEALRLRPVTPKSDLARYRPMLQANKANWESFVGGEANHAWTAYPGYLFQKYILGIQPTSGGFATFDVRPETGGLNFAEGVVPTAKGLITTRWEKSADGRFSFSVSVPANTRAAIYLPKLHKGAVTVTESGKLLWPATAPASDPGVIAVTGEDGSIKCLVGAGAYRFCEAPVGSN